ncbi:MAG: cobyrinate a,c-diamide synthase [Synergistaceae bacterium]|jgi:cobyrinic acid a,c-diamide synthase|nr:cobyrinate a,c-diamide synthase [Synergistaceae bacterium]
MKPFSDVKGFILAAASSGTGKTTAAAAICRALSEKGLAVQPFKTGPDFVDPTYLSLASGRRCRSLDGFPNPELMPFFYAEGCAARDGAPKADIAVIEGVMGMYDGLGPEGLYSTAWLARALGLPVILLVDAKAAATSVAATVKGFASLEPLAPKVAGVIANRVSSERHAKLIEEALDRFVGIPLIGWLGNLKDSSFLSRQLGLIPAPERKNADDVIDRFAREAAQRIDMSRLAGIAQPPSGNFIAPPAPDAVKKPDGASVKAAIASDDAFCFHYPENWELMKNMGAEVVFTSPLNDERVPADADILILPGGYPEEFASLLSRNLSYIESVRDFSRKKRVYAECGGMMYLSRSLEHHGERFDMAGVIETDVKMQSGLHRFGYVEGTALRDNILFKEGESARAHEFHYSSMEGRNPEAFRVKRASGRGEEWIDGFVDGERLLATYLHLNFYSCPQSVRRLLSF